MYSLSSNNLGLFKRLKKSMLQSKREVIPLRRSKVTILIILDDSQLPLKTKCIFWQVSHICSRFPISVVGSTLAGSFLSLSLVETAREKIVTFGRLSGRKIWFCRWCVQHGWWCHSYLLFCRTIKKVEGENSRHDNDKTKTNAYYGIKLCMKSKGIEW